MTRRSEMGGMHVSLKEGGREGLQLLPFGGWGGRDCKGEWEDASLLETVGEIVAAQAVAFLGSNGCGPPCLLACLTLY